MSGSNEGICFGCRKSGQLLEDCKQKRRCPRYGKGYVKWMQVVKVLKTKGRLFFCCSEDECTYFKWDNGQPSRGFVEGQSSSVGLDKSMGKEINEDLPSMFKLLASLLEEKDVEISLNLTIRKSQGKVHELDS
ncbi:DNA-directed RNA polymerase 1B [Abeliophyllum distichum]|uniref:DNA-directed RNA polymerase 1B n=1 Tax=Abeliophyllum distichum TaxID=126358 RepID=A0ABD1R9G7_9LAMI